MSTGSDEDIDAILGEHLDRARAETEASTKLEPNAKLDQALANLRELSTDGTPFGPLADDTPLRDAVASERVEHAEAVLRPMHQITMPHARVRLARNEPTLPRGIGPKLPRITGEIVDAPPPPAPDKDEPAPALPRRRTAHAVALTFGAALVALIGYWALTSPTGRGATNEMTTSEMTTSEMTTSAPTSSTPGTGAASTAAAPVAQASATTPVTATHDTAIPPVPSEQPAEPGVSATYSAAMPSAARTMSAKATPSGTVPTTMPAASTPKPETSLELMFP